MFVELSLYDRQVVKSHLTEKRNLDVEALKNPTTNQDMTNFYRGRIDVVEELLRELQEIEELPDELEA